MRAMTMQFLSAEYSITDTNPVSRKAGESRMQGTISVEHVSRFRLDWDRIPHAPLVGKQGRISTI